jgi:teichuronic acid biosynthesis glycosyltransferase TuaH
MSYHLRMQEAVIARNPVQRRFAFFSATGYESLVSGRTRRLAEMLARLGHNVSFVELPGLRNAARSSFRFGPQSVPDPPVRVVRLCPLPGYLRLAGTWPARRWVAHTVRRLNEWVEDLDRSVLITSTPWWAPVIRSLPGALRCYDYIDHIQVQAGPGRLGIFREWDEALLGTSDVVTTVSEPLRNHLAARFAPDRIFLVPNGVLHEWIDSPAPPVAREMLARRPERTIAGFLGSLFEWIDFGLLEKVARNLPQVEFVLVGPTRRGVRLDALAGMDNVRRLPPVPFSDVPKVIKAFDVCLIPFCRDVVAECADPLKVYEYCALGKPVVSTVEFKAHGRPAPVAVAGTAADFAAAVEGAVARDSAERRAERIAFARRHTWEQRADAFIAATDAALGK